MNESRSRAAAVLAAAALIVVLAGCTASRWHFVRQRPDETAITRITVTSEPAGAEVALNGKYLGTTPFVVPVRHACEVRVYERREALPYVHVVSREMRTWKANRFKFQFHLPGFHDTERAITLTGEPEAELSVALSSK